MINQFLKIKRMSEQIKSDPVSDYLVEVKDLSVIYNNGHLALSNASFQLNAQTICALVGVNGSGKSTLFKAIMGFVKPSRGQVLVAGRSVKLALKQNLISYVPQSEDVDWSFPLSVWDVALMGRYGHMNFLRMAKPVDRQIAEESLRKVQMWEYKDRQIGELSGGQKKRVFLARALAQRGKILLLDEPFTGVDVKTEAAIIELLRELRDDGHMVLVSTHDLGSVPEFCDQAVIINRTVLAFGDLHDVFTESNISKAFGGAIRHFRFMESTLQAHDGKAVTVMTDDERPLVFGKDGHLEFRSRKGREDVLRSREQESKPVEDE